METLRYPNINFPVSGLAAIIVTGMLLYFNYHLSLIYLPIKIPDSPEPVFIPYEKAPEPVDLVETEVITQEPIVKPNRDTTPQKTNEPVTVIPIPPGSIDRPSETDFPKFIPGINVKIPHTREWFTPDQVDQRPRVLRSVLPTYPYNATANGIEGRVVVRFVVNENGGVENPEVVKADPEGVFEEAAIAAIVKYKFIPAKVGGEKVKCSAILPIGFKIN